MGVKGSTNNFAAKSIPCWEPESTRICSLDTGNPNSASQSANRARSMGSPSLGPYCCNAAARQSCVQAESCKIGMASALGKPPTNEIIPGACAAARISRTNEDVSRDMRSDNCGAEGMMVSLCLIQEYSLGNVGHVY